MKERGRGKKGKKREWEGMGGGVKGGRKERGRDSMPPPQFTFKAMALSEL